MEKENCGEEELRFETRDIHCAAALLSLPLGYRLEGIGKDDPKRCVFIFFRDDGIDDMAHRYFLDRLEVKARTFADNLRSLKNQIYR